MTGWYLAKGWSQPGIVLTGMQVLEMKAKAKAAIDMPCAAWLSGAAARPMTMKTTVNTMP